MSDFSVSDLGTFQSTEPIDLSTIAPKRGPRFPRAGFYTLRVDEALIPEFTFSETKAGHLSAEINPTIVGGDSDGFQVRFQKLSAKTFRENVYDNGQPTGESRTTSQIARFLAACGDSRQLTGDPDQAAIAVMEQAGKEFRAILDWRAYNKRLGEETVGMENFPKSAAGNPLPWIEDAEDLVPNPKNEEELVAKRYPARVFVKRYVTR